MKAKAAPVRAAPPWAMQLASDDFVAASDWLGVWPVEVEARGERRYQELVWHRESVTIIPLVAPAVAGEPARVLVVKNWKHAASRFVWEFPAGYLNNPAEEPLIAAVRELSEETGYTSERWLCLGHPLREPGRSLARTHVYVAVACTRAAAPRPESSEALEAFAIPWSVLVEMLSDGRMESAHCLVALGLYWSRWAAGATPE